MKVVHLGDSDRGGGAANAMSRLHEGLQRLGVDSRLLVRNGADRGSVVKTIATRGDGDEFFPPVRDAVMRQYVELNRTGASNTHFSLHIDGADVSSAPLVAGSDIVHLHWTAPFQTPADVQALLDAKPVVWTLHDLEPLTGGCHFPAGCEGYVNDCDHCPQLVRDPFRITATTLLDKKTLWATSRPTFVAPSRDIAVRARRSAIFQHIDGSIVHIPHGIDVEVFRPQSKAAARHALGLPVDGLYVLCGSNYNAEQRKGLRFVEGVVAAATAASPPGSLRLTLLTVGEPKLELRDLGDTPIIQLGRVPLDTMPSVYAASDVFLHPSVEDNFPGMLLESLSCGVPAIAFDVGGVPDIVHDGVCGRLLPAGDALAMGTALSSLAGDRESLQRMSESARAYIEQHFNDVSIARKHAELYADVVARRSAAGARDAASETSGIDAIFPRWSAACLVGQLAEERHRIVALVRESQEKSEHTAVLEGNVEELARALADQSRQVQEKEIELSAIHAVAEERRVLAHTLHASAASIEMLAARLQREIGEQRAEIELVHGVAADRGVLIEGLHGAKSEHVDALEILAARLRREIVERDDRIAALAVTVEEQRAEIELVHRAAAERGLLIEERSREVQEKESELAAIHDVAEERKALAQTLHDAAANIEALAANLQREVRVRDDRLAKLAEMIDAQRDEIELVHRVAAERGAVIERLAALPDAPR